MLCELYPLQLSNFVLRLNDSWWFSLKHKHKACQGSSISRPMKKKIFSHKLYETLDWCFSILLLSTWQSCFKWCENHLLFPGRKTVMNNMRPNNEIQTHTHISVPAESQILCFHGHTDTNTHRYACTRAHTLTHCHTVPYTPNMHTHNDTHTDTHTLTHTPTFTQTHTPPCTCTDTQTHTLTMTHTRLHTNTHRH